jgi:hypothetical protein
MHQEYPEIQDSASKLQEVLYPDHYSVLNC